MAYEEFLARKAPVARVAGFEVSDEELAGRYPILFDWQRAIVRWACRLGRAAIFAECGLGKTLMQLAWAAEMRRHYGDDVLVICPLAVAQQTIREAGKIGLGVEYVREQPAGAGVYITNYEMAVKEDVFDLGAFGAVVLDESSRLKAFTSKTKQALIRACAPVTHRLACTATPSPNDVTELGNHSEFLGQMDSGEMLTRFFIRDSQHANELRLKGHARKAFWSWVGSWAVACTVPSDLGPGYSDEGYHLPSLELVYHMVDVDHSRAWEQADENGQAALFVDGNRSATDMWAEKRAGLDERVVKVCELLAAIPSDEPVTIWHDTDYERDALARAIPELTVVTGSQSPEDKERLLSDFSEGRVRLMATKPRIGGWGLNWQHCHHTIYAGVTHKFEELYQSLKRHHRFGQASPVTAHLVYTEAETGIVETLQAKWRSHEEMHAQMVAAMREAGLAGQGSVYTLETEAVTAVTRGRAWEVRQGDSVLLLRDVETASVGLSVSSWPFSDQYMYSPSVHDMGNVDDDEEFFEGMGFLLPELYRVTVPGRLAIVHAKDRIVYGTKNDGYGCIAPFSDNCIRAMMAAGFLFQGRITIATDPVRENNQTNRLGYGNLQKDASRLYVGMPEYLLLFRRPHTQTARGGTWSDEPVTMPDSYSLPRWQIDANSLWRTSGRRLAPWEAEGYDYHAHVAAMEDADRRGELGRANGQPIPTDHPAVWWDVRRANVLNNLMAREQQDERHICPLQLDVCERAIVRWSNPGDLVLDYFGGIGSVGYVAIQQRRRALLMELKPSYAQAACRYLAQVEQATTQMSLFSEAVV